MVKLGIIGGSRNHICWSRGLSSTASLPSDFSRQPLNRLPDARKFPPFFAHTLDTKTSARTEFCRLPCLISDKTALEPENTSCCVDTNRRLLRAGMRATVSARSQHSEHYFALGGYTKKHGLDVTDAIARNRMQWRAIGVDAASTSGRRLLPLPHFVDFVNL